MEYEVQTEHGKVPLGTFVAVRFDKCRQCTDETAAYNHETCEEYRYGMRGFSDQFFYDSLCNCPHHKAAAQFIKDQRIIEQAIENEIDEMIESSHDDRDS